MSTSPLEAFPTALKDLKRAVAAVRHGCLPTQVQQADIFMSILVFQTDDLACLSILEVSGISVETTGRRVWHKLRPEMPISHHTRDVPSLFELAVLEKERSRVITTASCQ